MDEERYTYVSYPDCPVYFAHKEDIPEPTPPEPEPGTGDGTHTDGGDTSDTE